MTHNNILCKLLLTRQVTTTSALRGRLCRADGSLRIEGEVVGYNNYLGRDCHLTLCIILAPVPAQHNLLLHNQLLQPSCDATSVQKLQLDSCQAHPHTSWSNALAGVLWVHWVAAHKATPGTVSNWWTVTE
jgi:hypothetical protein